jgi:hypothetical protein
MIKENLKTLQIAYPPPKKGPLNFREEKELWDHPRMILRKEKLRDAKMEA